MPTIRFPDDLYDKVMETSGGRAQDFVQDATRFWIEAAEASGDPLPQLTTAQEALARQLLHFLFHTTEKQRQGILMLMEDWYERTRAKT